MFSHKKITQSLTNIQKRTPNLFLIHTQTSLLTHQIHSYKNQFFSWKIFFSIRNTQHNAIKSFFLYLNYYCFARKKNKKQKLNNFTAGAKQTKSQQP